MIMFVSNIFQGVHQYINGRIYRLFGVSLALMCAAAKP
jgi:hypothetical protein